MRFPSALAWAGSTQVAVVGIGMVVSALTARALGPEGFGALAFYLSASYIAAPIAKWGLDLTLVRHTVSEKATGRQLVGSALVVRLLTGALACLMTLSLAAFLRTEESDVWTIGLPVLLAMVIGAGGVLTSAYQGSGRWDISSMISIASSLTLLVLTLAFSRITNDPVLFAGARALEALATTVVALAFVGVLLRRGTGVATLTAHSLLREGLPFLSSGIVVALYSRFDQVLIASLMDDRALGHYAAATQVVFGWWAISGVLVLVLRPAILKANTSRENLNIAVRTSFDVAVVFSYVAIGATFLFGYPLIIVLFGRDFLDAFPALMLLSLTIPSAALGGIRTSYMLARSQDSLYFLTTVIGLGVSLAFNLALIPLLGIAGAAIAAVFAHTVAVLGSCFLFKESREVGKIMIRSILWPKHVFDIARVRAVLMPAAPSKQPPG